MLFCRPDLAEFYERHGFLKIKGPVWVQQAHELVQMPLLAMWHAIREGALLQPGPIVVNSLPF